MQILCDLDTVQYKEKPTADTPSIRYRQAYRHAAVYTLEQIKNAVEHGQTVIPADLNCGTTDKDWKAQQFFLVDIDNAKDARLTIENALKICKALEIPPCLIYTTFTHNGKDKIKYRLCFATPNVITDKQEREEIHYRLITPFVDFADTECLNSSRIFYGGREGAAVYVSNDFLDVEKVLKLTKYVKKEKKKKQTQAYTPTNKHYRGSSSSSLRTLLDSYPIQNYFIEFYGCSYDNGYLEPCPICTHSGDCKVYEDSNRIYCYGGNGDKWNGNLLDFLIEIEHLTPAEAVRRLKEDILHIPYATYFQESSFMHAPADLSESMQVKEVREKEAKKYRKALLDNKEAREYLRQDISEELEKDLYMGYTSFDEERKEGAFTIPLRAYKLDSVIIPDFKLKKASSTMEEPRPLMYGYNGLCMLNRYKQDITDTLLAVDSFDTAVELFEKLKKKDKANKYHIVFSSIGGTLLKQHLSTVDWKSYKHFILYFYGGTKGNETAESILLRYTNKAGEQIFTTLN